MLKWLFLPLFPRPYIPMIVTDETGVLSKWASWHHMGIYADLALHWGDAKVHIMGLCTFFLVIWLHIFVDWKFVFLFTNYHHQQSSMPWNPVLDVSSSNEENEVPPVPHPQKTFKKSCNNLSGNIQLPNRICGASKHTLSAKQQAISKSFSYVPCVLADVC